jgi:hydroxyacylglutathione hydrolase
VPVFGPARESIPGRTHALEEGQRVSVPGVDLALRVLDVPGHTAGHIAYVGECDGEPVAFVGDTLFAAGCGRLFEGTAHDMARSLAKLAALPGATRIYCAHEYTLANLRFARAVEPDSAALRARQARDEARRARNEPTVPSLLADELATNPFLRAGVPAVFAAAEAHAGRPLANAVEAFATLREWKNGFR